MLKHYLIKVKKNSKKYILNYNNYFIIKYLSQNRYLTKDLLSLYQTLLNNKFLKTRVSITTLEKRCIITGKARGLLKNFKISRNFFRFYASDASITGVKKSSW